MTIEVTHHAGATRWESLDLSTRHTAARRLLKIPKAGVGKGQDARTVMRRHLLVWLLLAGRAGVSEVAREVGLTHPAVMKVRDKLLPWPSASLPAVARLIDWAGLYEAGACGGPSEREAGLEAAYGALRGKGWPWKRSGKAGNKGGGAAAGGAR